jgi:transcriptional regulator with XRE-family HTH domain
MDELIKNVDVKEMGRRFKLVRQRLGLTQTDVANQLNTTQLMIHRIEKGDNILSPLFLAVVLFYSRSVSLEGLLGKNFDIDDESLFSKDYALNSIVKAKLNAIRDEYLDKLKEAEKGFVEQMDAAADLL